MTATRTPPSGGSGVTKSDAEHWKELAFRAAGNNTVLQKENIVLRQAMMEIAELLNADRRFCTGDELTCNFIAATVKRCLQQDIVQAVILATEE